MSERRLYWLKLKESFFTDKAMKKLRRMAGGDTYTVIYLKMLLLGLKNNGRIYYDGVEDTFHEEIALELDEEPENVQFCMLFLEKNGLLEKVSETEAFLTETPELTISEAASTARSRRSRAKKALQCNGDATVTQQCCNKNATLDIDNKRKDTDTDIEAYIAPSCSAACEPSARARTVVDYQAIVDDYNRTCTKLPACKKLSETRKRAIKARLNTYSAEELHKVFVAAQNSSWHTGENDRNWRADFDWLMTDRNAAKMLERYERDGGGTKLDDWEKDWLAEYRAMTKEQEQEEQHDNNGSYQSAELAD